jgi:hypothetical protein
MKFNYTILLISLVQSAPLIEEVGGILTAGRGNGLVGSIPVLGPLVGGIVGGLPIVGSVLGGKSSQQQPYYNNKLPPQPQQPQQAQYQPQKQSAPPGFSGVQKPKPW